MNKKIECQLNSSCYNSFFDEPKFGLFSFLSKFLFGVSLFVFGFFVFSSVCLKNGKVFLHRTNEQMLFTNFKALEKE